MPTAYETAVAALPGLIGWWKLNEGSGTTITDSKGTAGNGTASGSGITYAQTSLLAGDPTNTSLLFDGTNGRIVVSETATLDMTGSISMIAWAQPTDVSTDHSLMFKQPFAWGVFHRAPGVWSVEISPSSAKTQNYTALSGLTQMVAGTYDGATISDVVNGVLLKQTSMSSAITTNANGFEIGAWNGSQKFKGYIQHVALCNQAVPLTTLQNLYVIGATAAGGPTSVYPFSTKVFTANGPFKAWNPSDQHFNLGLGSAAVKGSGPYLAARSGHFEGSFVGDVYAIHHGYLGAKTISYQLG